jgi:tetratricopeptide (TPR) repeat protein
LKNAAVSFNPFVTNNFAIYHQENPWVALASNFGSLKQPEEAIVAINTYFETQAESPFDFQNYATRATFYEQLGHYAEAAADFEKAAKVAPPGFPNDYQIRRVSLLLKANKTESATDGLHEILKSGKIKDVLKIQVFLKNQGYDGFEINGLFDDATIDSLKACLKDKNCSKAAGQAI